MSEPQSFEEIQEAFNEAIGPVIADAYSEVAEVWNALDEQYALELRRQLIVLQPIAMRILRTLQQHTDNALAEMRYASLPLLAEFDRELGHTKP